MGSVKKNQGKNFNNTSQLDLELSWESVRFNKMGNHNKLQSVIVGHKFKQCTMFSTNVQ